MKNRKVIFSEDYTASFDGVNKRDYKKGKEYLPTHAHEARMFEHLAQKGFVSYEGEEKAVGKVSPPKETKAKKAQAKTKAKKQ